MNLNPLHYIAPVAGSAASIAGQAFHLPDLGVSERLGAPSALNSNNGRAANALTTAALASGAASAAGAHRVVGVPHPNAASEASGSIVSDGATVAARQAAAAAAAQARANQQAMDIANSALGRLPHQLNIAQGNINSQYGQQLNELNSDKSQNQSSYNTSTNQNQQDRVSNLNTIDQQASSGLRGLLRLLGQHGAGGSSAAMFAAPDAVNTVATQQRSGAGQTFGQNQQALDTNWNNYLTGYDTSKDKLNDWRSQQLNNAESTSDQNKQSLLQTLASLQSSPDAAQGYIDKINNLAGHIDDLGKLNPTYTGKTPVYNAPDVASYTVDQTGTPVLQDPNSGATSTPWLNILLGQRDRQTSPLL